MKTQGWIKLHRSIANKWWYNKPDYLSVWIYLLLGCSHKRYETRFNGEIIMLEPGQMVTGRRQISEATGVKETTVEYILSVFTKEEQITQVKKNKSRCVSILNWLRYQGGLEAEKSLTTNRQQIDNKNPSISDYKSSNSDMVDDGGLTTDRQQIDTIQEERRKNKKKEIDKEKRKTERMKKPTIDEIVNYFIKRGVPDDISKREGRKFFDYYESCGWTVGKNKPMKSWKGSVGLWISRLGEFDNKEKLPSYVTNKL